MSNDCSPESANRVVTFHKATERKAAGAAVVAQHVAARRGVSRAALHLAYIDAPPRELPPQALPEQPEKSFWSSVLGFLVDGLANCGTSLYPVACLAAGGALIEAEVPVREAFAPTERRAALSLVSNTARQPDDGNHAHVLAMVSQISSQPLREALLHGSSRRGSFSALPSRQIVQPARWSWLRSCWETVVSLHAHMRREREIRQAIDALAELDDFSLKDIGIHHRSQIEDAVRNAGHDC